VFPLAFNSSSILFSLFSGYFGDTMANQLTPGLFKRLLYIHDLIADNLSVWDMQFREEPTKSISYCRSTEVKNIWLVKSNLNQLNV
jgi:hypothetical protein